MMPLQVHLFYKETAGIGYNSTAYIAYFEVFDIIDWDAW